MWAEHRAEDPKDFVTNSNYIIRHTQTNYNKGANIIKALKEGKHVNFNAIQPRLKMSKVIRGTDKNCMIKKPLRSCSNAS